MSAIITAIAKKDVTITLHLDINNVSFNTKSVKKGESLQFPVFKREKLTSKKHIEELGEEIVVLKDGIHYIPTYSKDFEYIQ